MIKEQDYLNALEIVKNYNFEYFVIRWIIFYYFIFEPPM